ncbi:MAG: hypothetical protein ACRDRU_06635 [Pseudonocardiaceae bacterium]
MAKRVVGSAILFGSFLLLPAYEFVLHQFNLEKTWITQVLMAVGFCGVILLVKLFVNAPAKKMINDSRRSCGERELSARASQAEIDRLVSSSVLYLRSFGDEAFTSLALDDNLSWPFSIKTHEERLVKSLSIVGQVVTVGRPKENLPELGAKRVYLLDHEWRSVVTEWITSARLVVLRIGASDGVWWETQTSITRASPERLLLLVPHSKRGYSTFRKRFNSEFSGFSSLPEIREEIDSHLYDLAGFIYFDQNRVGHFERLPESIRGMRKAFIRFSPGSRAPQVRSGANPGQRQFR